jgi:hypothetical protein
MPRVPRKSSSSPDQIYLRDTREKGWFWVQNELIDVFAPLIGPYAVAVYVCLARKCEGNSALTQWSQRELEKVWQSEVEGAGAALSRTSIRRALAQLVAAGLIVVDRPATRSEGPVYALLSLRQIAAALTPEMAEKLAVRLELARERNQTEIEEGGPVGPTLDMLKTLRKSCGEPCGNDSFSTEIPGPHVGPIDPKVGPTGPPSLLEESKNINTPTPTSPEGRGSDEISCSDSPDRARSIAIHQAWRVAEVHVREHLCRELPRKLKRRLPRDGYADWKKYFADLYLNTWREDQNGRVAELRILAPGVDSSFDAFGFYQPTWTSALEKAFGTAPKLVLLPARREAEMEVAHA